MTDVERPCRNTVNKSLLLLFFINILQAVVPKKKRKRKRTYNCFDNALMGNHSLLTDPLFSLQSPSGSRATLINDILFCTDLWFVLWKAQQLGKASGNMSVNTAEQTFVETDTLNRNYHLSIQQSEEPLGLSDIFVMRHTRDESLLRELSSRCREGASVHTAIPRSYQVIIFS